MKTRIKRLAAIFMAAAVLTGLAAGCGSTGNQTKTAGQPADTQQEAADGTEEAAVVTEEAAETEGAGEKIVINIADFKQYPATSQIIIADKQGFFEKELEGDHAEVNIVKFLNGPAINEAFAAGDIDIAPIGEFPALTGINNTRAQKIIATDIENVSEGIITRADSGINTLEDLKGKKLGFAIGTADQLLLEIFLEEGNLTIDDIQPINLPDPVDKNNSLISGAVDAIISYEPGTSTLQKEIDIKTVIDNSDYPVLVVFTARTEILDTYPEVVVDILKAIQDANEWIAKNPEEAVKIVSEETGIAAEDIKATFARLNNTLELDEAGVKRLERAVEFLAESDIVDESFVLKEYIDTSFADRALEK